ncbi:hypothetical protein OAM96_02010 [Candidatus Poseidoniaceae archaeon]|nr:hypothetical protein [Candidatus Poseidoniaceae archaeon]|tara:strand:- start:2076 stop:2345 length:270 start_codon:yes stop_codon:yes gene_type:complete
MEETWEDIAWEGETLPKEWVVEYIALVDGEKIHHLSILYGEDHQDVQRSLLHELRIAYPGSGRIDVTVLRMEETVLETDALHFDGDCIP